MLLTVHERPTEIEGADDNKVEVSAHGIQNVYIAAVTSIDHYTTCVNCNSKIENPIPANTGPDPDIFVCGNCSTMLRFSECTTEVKANFLVKSSPSSHPLALILCFFKGPEGNHSRLGMRLFCFFSTYFSFQQFFFFLTYFAQYFA